MALSLDIADNAYVVAVAAGKLEVSVSGPNLRFSTPIPPAPGWGGEQGEPDVTTGSRGAAYLCYTERPAGLAGRDVFLTHNLGGRFVEPRRLSQGPDGASHVRPRIALDGGGNPHVVWTRTLGGSEPAVVMYYDGVTREVVEVASGEDPDIVLDLAGHSHVAYRRDNDIFYNERVNGAFMGEARVSTTPSELESDVQIGVTEAGTVLIGYVSGGTLYLVSKRLDGTFTVPRILDAGGVSEVEFKVRPTGVVSAAYIKQGDVFHVQGLAEVVLPPNRIFGQTVPVEAGPRHEISRCGVLHVAFLREDEVYYSNNASQIEAEFTAEVRHGELPLAVQFQDLSTGKVQAWRWDFGDGAQSPVRHPVHVYDRPGTYTVTLRVFAADRESVAVKEKFIAVQEPFNVLRIPDQRVKQGQADVWFPVLAEHRDPVMAFQVHGTFDPAILYLDPEDGCSLEGTFTEILAPEVWECNLFERSFEIGCIFDFVAPFDGRTLAPGTSQTLVHLIFDVHEDAPVGARSRIDLVNNREVSAIFNIFTVDNVSKLPVLEGATVTVVERDIPESFFLRGDVDSSGIVDITDAINILGFLFLGGRTPACMDAADVSDRGTVDISAAIFVLNFLFLGGAAPAVPFPVPGLDPTPDAWVCE